MKPNSHQTSNPRSRLLGVARERLLEFGITLDVESGEPQADADIDAVVTLSRDGQGQQYRVELKESMTLSALMRGRGAVGPSRESPFPLLVIGDRISQRSAAAFRDAGIQFVDRLGNASIRFASVLIEVQGRTDSVSQRSEAPHDPVARQPANIFSSRRAQVIFALLTWPELATAKIRGIAEAAGVSVGQVHETVRQLQETGFIVPVSKRLDRVEELLELWTAAYPTGLGRRLEIAKFHGDPARPVSGLRADQPCYLSSESARGSGVLRPATLTVYLDDLGPRLPALNRWDASPDRPANIFVRRKFWASPHADEEKPVPEGQNAPWPLVYADLLSTRDARLSEVARNWRSQHARPGEV
ncbi:type IV toxin-antitoxin system AbiEi family antitoxin [Actinoplanes sp. NPDC048791]|uniref:type IV toxin-antitoxin system AbiEi family antitoxin n=1 Tax=Actinoplanes sp. NPDC048791 TaxID=3154623 RepID=UPI0033F199FC